MSDQRFDHVNDDGDAWADTDDGPAEENATPDADFDLLRRWGGGNDEVAGGHLYRRYSGEITRFFAREVQDAAEAYDLTVETFLALKAAAMRFRGEAKVRTFLHRIAKNQLKICLRKRRLYGRYFSNGMSAAISIVAGVRNLIGTVTGQLPNSLLGCDRDGIILCALRTLSPDQQEAVHLHHFRAFGRDAVARIIGVKKTTVDGRIRLGREGLAKAIERMTPKDVAGRSRPDLQEHLRTLLLETSRRFVLRLNGAERDRVQAAMDRLEKAAAPEQSATAENDLSELLAELGEETVVATARQLMLLAGPQELVEMERLVGDLEQLGSRHDVASRKQRYHAESALLDIVARVRNAAPEADRTDG